VIVGILASVTGWIALPISILRYQAKTGTGVLLMSALASFLFAIHYALIGALPGAALTASGGLTSLIQVFSRKSLSMSFRLLIALPSVAFSLYLSSSNPLGGLAILAFAASRLAEIWEKEWHMRCTMVVAAILWVTYAAAEGALPVVIAEAVGLISAMIALWRFGYRPRTIDT
jgi:hypothetical protein